MIVIVRYFILIHGLEERPRGAVILHAVQDTLERIVQSVGDVQRRLDGFGALSALGNAPGSRVRAALPSSLANPWYRLDGDSPDALLEACQSWMHLLYLLLLLVYQLFDNLLLLSQNCRELRVDYFGVQLAVHQSGTLVILDVAVIHWLWQFDVLGETLLSKVTNGKLIGKRQKVQDIVLYVIVLEHVHQMRSVTLYLLLARNSAKNNLREALICKHAETNSTNWPSIFDERNSFVLSGKEKKVAYLCNQTFN